MTADKASKQYFENVLEKRRERENKREQIVRQIHDDAILNGHMRSNEKVERMRQKNRFVAVKEAEEKENDIKLVSEDSKTLHGNQCYRKKKNKS